MKRTVWTLWALGVCLLIASCFPSTESMAWVPMVAGSFILIALSAVLAYVTTRKK